MVDPTKRIVSTLHIDDQQWDKYRSRYLYALDQATSNELPKELGQLICEYLRTGFTASEAEAIRSKLMVERKYRADYHARLWERRYSYCEVRNFVLD